MKTHVVALSDVGRLRDDNEDEFLVRSDLKLFAVADGVGGAAAGEVASHIFVKCCETEFLKVQDCEVDYRQTVSDCFENANRHIAKYGTINPDAAGMGCTAEVLTFDKGNFVIGHVGDSRSYLFRDVQLRRVTRDHSVMQERIDMGLPTDEQTPLPSNAIYLAVGHMNDTPADIYVEPVYAGDLFLMCSDGLTDMVSEADIASILLHGESDLQQTLQNLVAAANNGGGRDNITVVLVKVISV
ncbi:MAG: protein phosphatase 2C domain-containing protein [Gammaproteobacteria bacterium]|nr:protein phosphatase 2C domain-containing protein [Gammaproteobacteria bacterium]